MFPEPGTCFPQGIAFIPRSEKIIRQNHNSAVLFEFMTPQAFVYLKSERVKKSLAVIYCQYAFGKLA
jgi:hypothetical protein